MHSRIFKLQANLDENYNEIREYDFEENGFLNGFHDYVRSLDEDETLDSYNWLINCCKDIFKNYRKDGEYYYVDIYKDDIKEFLKEIIEKAKEEIINLDLDKEYFSFYNLKTIVGGDESGFYFYLDDTYYNEVEFMTTLYGYNMKNKDKITFRLEGALDYHS